MIEFLQSKHSVKCTPMVIDESYPSPHLEDWGSFLLSVKDRDPRVISKFRSLEIKKYEDRADPVSYYVGFSDNKPVFLSEVWSAKFSGELPRGFVNPKVQTSVELLPDHRERFKGVAAFVSMNLIARSGCQVTDRMQTPSGSKFWWSMLSLNSSKVECVLLKCPRIEKPNTVTVLDCSGIRPGNRVPQSAWTSEEIGVTRRVAFRMIV